MKRLLITFLLLGFAGSAVAAITGTAHDLSSANTGTSDEICVYCHTPHGADTTVTLAPLWNRSTTNAAGSVYAGVQLEASTKTDMTIANINQTDAPLCLSCHDGTVAETLKNEPNAGTTNLTGYVWGSAAANLTTDMSNDHPIAFDFVNVAGGDGGTGSDAEIHSKAVAETALGTGALSYGSGGNDMWCSSCHDVHDDTNTPFLRISNSGSALCLACHIK